MYCPNCGTELPETANYCINCGTPQEEEVKKPKYSEVRWEFCEIVYENIDTSLNWNNTKIIRFWANAGGPEGTYSAGESDKCEVHHDWPSFSGSLFNVHDPNKKEKNTLKQLGLNGNNLRINCLKMGGKLLTAEEG